ncbi:AGAP013483-PA-like protein [Anopheles sinensis]|uniref:AGAP013483-PA-like protein n=1 Tax=Anopheles sinensis TaxID=74873 RepID=A0A084VHD1_ANOSI|nr:AGAP013483-PA-like protein [Anopheles sinensis]
MKATLFFLVVVLCVVAISAQGPEQHGKGKAKGGAAGSERGFPIAGVKGKGKGIEKGDAAARAEAGKAHAQNGGKGKEAGQGKQNGKGKN